MAASLPPVISLRPLRDPESNESARRTVSELEASFKEFACVCIPVSDMAAEGKGEELLHRCYSAADNFFAMPEAFKAAYTEEEAAKKGFGGSCFTPLGKEPAYVEGEKQHVESFSCTRPLDESLCDHLPGGPELHKSLFPDSQVPDFGAAYSCLWETLRERISLPMMDALEQMMCVPRGFLHSKSAETSSLNASLLRTLHYPARDGQHTSTAPGKGTSSKRRRSSRNRAATAPIDVGISDHTDFEVFTIMHQQSAGLHLHTPSREPSPHWYQLPLRPDTLTVILGDMVELWTSGWLEATRHRVDSPASGQEPRRSFVLFQAHDDEVRVHPLGLADLAPRDDGPGDKEEEDIQNATKSRKPRADDENSGHASRRGDTFVEWVQHRPKNARKKYSSTTQGAWVRKREFQAKSARERST